MTSACPDYLTASKSTGDMKVCILRSSLVNATAYTGNYFQIVGTLEMLLMTLMIIILPISVVYHFDISFMSS